VDLLVDFREEEVALVHDRAHCEFGLVNLGDEVQVGEAKTGVFCNV
jgi:hypothetical protein